MRQLEIQRVLDRVYQLSDYDFQIALWNKVVPAGLIYLPVEVAEELFGDSGLVDALESSERVFGEPIDDQLRELHLRFGSALRAYDEGCDPKFVDGPEMQTVRELAAQISDELSQLGLEDWSEEIVEEFWAQIDGGTSQFRERVDDPGLTHDALPRLMRLYRSLDAGQQVKADRVLADWALSGGYHRQPYAVWLISLFDITSARPALERLLETIPQDGGSREASWYKRVRSVIDALG